MKRKRRSRKNETAKQFVVSFRVNAEEWEALKKETEQSGLSVSRLLRANLHLLFRPEQGAADRFTVLGE